MMKLDKEKELPKRKDIRLKNYDYSSSGGYFLTICTLERRNYFWANVGATIGRPQAFPISFVGESFRPLAGGETPPLLIL
jgi:hypothetical protein